MHTWIKSNRMSEIRLFCSVFGVAACGISIYIVFNRFLKRDEKKRNEEDKLEELNLGQDELECLYVDRQFQNEQKTGHSMILQENQRTIVPDKYQHEPSYSQHAPLQSPNIHLICNFNECRHYMEMLAMYCNKHPAIGFDCEWVSAGNRGRVALLQLAHTQHGFCALIRLCKFRRIPKELTDILADKDIIKVGVEPKRDADYLFQDYGIVVNATLDLRYMAELAGCQPGGLGKMAQKYVNSPSNRKNWTIHHRWEDQQLTQEQIDYAAKDATDGIELFKFFANKLKERDCQQRERDCGDFFDKLDKKYSNRNQNQKKKNHPKKQKAPTVK